MRKILFFLVIFLSTLVFSKSFAIEVSLLEAEKRLIFQQLFSKQTCAKIYQKLKYGLKKKLDDDVRMELYHNLKRINIDEEKALLTLAFDQRTAFYKERSLELIIFNVLADQDFSDELANINKTIANSKSKKIVVCEYDLNNSIADASFFDFNLKYDNALNVETNVDPKVLIYYDGTIEYVYYDEKVTYAIPSLNYRKYPFDSHDLRFQITSNIYNKLYFERSDKFEILLSEKKDKDFSSISFPGWTIKKYISYPNSKPLEDVYSDYSEHSMVSELSFVRNFNSYIFKLIVPIIGITFLVYACVFMRIVDGRITLLGTLLFTFVAFEFVTLGQTPELQYITLLDWLIFLGYAFTVIAMIFSIIESYYLRGRKVLIAADLQEEDKNFLDRVRFYYKIILPITYLISLLIGYYFIISV